MLGTDGESRHATSSLAAACLPLSSAGEVATLVTAYPRVVTYSASGHL